MTYSQALERQVAIQRTLASPEGQGFLRGSFADAEQERRISYGGASVEDVAELLTFAVMQGEPYYWAPQVCDLLVDAAPTLPSYTLRREVLPSEVAYFHFASALRLPPRDGDVEDLAGIGAWWDAGTLRMTFFTNDYLSSAPGVPLPVTSGAWRTGTTWHECLGWMGSMGVEVAYPSRHELMVRYTAACLAFIEQPYFGVVAQHPERATRKRLERAGVPEAMIQVVQLRRSSSMSTANGHDDPRSVAWSCQWPVRPHWRLQAVGQDRAERRPVLVRGYIKGDPSKPLKAPNDRLFAVTR